MTSEFQEKYWARVEKTGSILCIGLDPGEYGFGKGNKKEKDCLPNGVNKRDWALKYIEAMAPFASAFKPNTNFWEGSKDIEYLNEVTNLARNLGLVTIEDSKRRDIGNTNDHGLYFAGNKRYDAVTFSPGAGNLEEATTQAHERGLGLISMCIMSNPEYERVKNSWVLFEGKVPDGLAVQSIDGRIHVRNYVDLAIRSEACGVDGLVIGAQSATNHIKDEEIADVARIYNGLILVPGIGAQGGEFTSLVKHFDRKRLIANVGRALMFPNGPNSTLEDQITTANHYMELLSGRN